MMKIAVVLIGLVIISRPVAAEIVSEPVAYTHDGVNLEGWIFYDSDWKDKHPLVLVVHEWKGLGDYAKMRARMLAELGYVGFAIDMYGKGVYAKDHEEAAKLSGVFRENREFGRVRAKAGLDTAKKFTFVDPERIAAIGYCFGGTTVLEMARAGFDVLGVASFHGSLSTSMPAVAGALKSRVLVLHGADDSFISAEDIKAFHDEMKGAGADWYMVSFGGAVHSFTVAEAGSDPSKGMAYNLIADKRSWDMLKSFLSEIF